MCEIQCVPMQKPANKNNEILSTAIQKITMNAKEKETKTAMRTHNTTESNV